MVPRVYGNDRQVRASAVRWATQKHRAALATVLSTFGGSPRHPGAMAAIREDGRLVGSVSDECVEDDLIDEVRAAKFWSHGTMTK